MLSLVALVVVIIGVLVVIIVVAIVAIIVIVIGVSVSSSSFSIPHCHSGCIIAIFVVASSSCDGLLFRFSGSVLTPRFLRCSHFAAIDACYCCAGYWWCLHCQVLPVQP